MSFPIPIPLTLSFLRPQATLSHVISVVGLTTSLKIRFDETKLQ